VEDILPLFDKELRVSRLTTGAVVMKGLAKLKILLGEPYDGKCEASKRVFFEPAKKGDPSLCLDMYCENMAPGWGPRGLTATPSESVVVLYRVEDNTINHVWLCDDEEYLAGDSATTKAGLMASETMCKVTEVVKDSMSTGKLITCHFSNYSLTEDSLGLGIGSASKVETFSL